jgi:hypothetical protein
MKIQTVPRPYILTFHASGEHFALTSADAQRLVDDCPVLSATPYRVVLAGTWAQTEAPCTLRPATLGGGPAFVIEREAKGRRSSR